VLRLLLILGARRPRGRSVLSAVGIALGVGLGYGVYLVNRAAVEDLAAAVRSLSGEADLQVRGSRGGFPEALYPRVAKLAGVAWVSPALELEAGVAGNERSLRVLGIESVRAGRIDLLRPDTAILSLAASQLARDGKLSLIAGADAVSLEVVAVDASLKGVIALTDVATAQWRLGRLGELNRLDVHLARGADRDAVAAAVAAVLPAGVHVSSTESLQQASGYPSRAYRVNLNVLAMVALFTGGFLVFSAQALEVARRRGEHALLRTLGLTRLGLARLVLLEAGALGIIGGLLGVALGYGFALGAVRAFGGDLGAGVFRGGLPDVGFSPLAAGLYVLAGVAVALAGALLPARDAARTSAARALKAGDDQAMLERVLPPWPGAALLAAGGALAALGPVRGLPVFGYAAIACLLVGSIALMPWISQWIFNLPLRFRRPPLALALAQLRGAPSQAAVSLAAIVASFSLMAAMAIMVASFRQSVDDWLEAVLPADLYFYTTHAGDTGYLDPEFVKRVAALPQVARAEFLRAGRVLLDPHRPALALLARDNPARYPMVGHQYPRKPDDPPPLWVSEAVADIYGFAPGRVLQVPLQGERQAFVVAGVFRDYARQHGALLMERSTYVGLTGDRRINDGALWLAPGASAADAMQALRGLPGGAQLELSSPPEIRELSLRIFDRSFAITYAMEAVAVLVGLFGLSSSLGAIVLARRREFGMLRHLGVTRGQVRAMLAAEGGLLALVGAAAGLAAGAAISLVLVFVVNRQSFNWSIELHPPYALLAGLVAILVALAIVTAMAAGREALGMGPVRAVREDW
jgi:putative ABC transport system permease protein